MHGMQRWDEEQSTGMRAAEQYKGREWRSEDEMPQLKVDVQAVGKGCGRKGAWRGKKNRKG